MTAIREKRGQAAKDQIDARVVRLKAKALQDFEAGLKRLNIARENSGCAALYRQADTLENQASAVHDRICETAASSFEALLWQLEVAREHVDDETLLEMIIAGVKRLAGRAELVGFGEPEDGGAA